MVSKDETATSNHSFLFSATHTHTVNGSGKDWWLWYHYRQVSLFMVKKKNRHHCKAWEAELVTDWLVLLLLTASVSVSVSSLACDGRQITSDLDSNYYRAECQPVASRSAAHRAQRAEHKSTFARGVERDVSVTLQMKRINRQVFQLCCPLHWQ